jgi:hypothetical protein
MNICPVGVDLPNRTDRHGEANSRVSQLYKRPNTRYYHNNVTNLIHFHFHNHFIVS